MVRARIKVVGRGLVARCGLAAAEAIIGAQFAVVRRRGNLGCENPAAIDVDRCGHRAGEHYRTMRKPVE